MFQIIFVTTIVAVIYGNTGATYSFIHCARSSCARLGPHVHNQPAEVTPLAGVPNVIHLHPDTLLGSTVTCCCYSRRGGDRRRLDCNKGWTHNFFIPNKMTGAGGMQHEKRTQRISCFQKSLCIMKRGWKVPLITGREVAEKELQMKAGCEDSCDQTEYKEKQSGSKIKIYVQMLHVQQ